MIELFSSLRRTTLLSAIVALAAIALNASVASAQVALGSAENFTVLAGTAVTCTDATIAGDVGVFLPGSAVTQTRCTVAGTVHAGDAVAQKAYLDFITAYNKLRDHPPVPCKATLTATLAEALLPGVYCVDATAKAGPLILDAQGNANAAWTFLVNGALTGTNFNVVMINGGKPCNVSWWVNGAATLTDSTFWELFSRARPSRSPVEPLLGMPWRWPGGNLKGPPPPPLLPPRATRGRGAGWGKGGRAPHPRTGKGTNKKREPPNKTKEGQQKDKERHQKDKDREKHHNQKDHKQKKHGRPRKRQGGRRAPLGGRPQNPKEGTMAKLVLGIAVGLAVALLAGWIWGASGRSDMARALQTSELRGELLRGAPAFRLHDDGRQQVTVPPHGRNVAIEEHERAHEGTRHRSERPAPRVAREVEHPQPPGDEQDRRFSDHVQAGLFEHLFQRAT